MDQNVVTDPSIVLNMDRRIGLTGTNYEHDLNEAMKGIMEQIGNFESNGSGWIIDKVH